MVSRIEKIEKGIVKNWAVVDRNGYYHCYPEGQTLAKYKECFPTLDDAAAYLVSQKRSRIRMDPNRGLIVDNICVDGVARETL